MSFALAVLIVPSGTAGAANSHTKSKTVVVSTAKVPHVGTVLTNGAGLTLYHFAGDPKGMATCTGVCATIWPPFLAAKGAHIHGPRGVKGLSLIAVGGGHWQVAFHGFALYRFEGDATKGQAKGEGLIGKWFAVLKSGIPAATAAGAAVTTTTGAPATTTTAPQGTTSTMAQHMQTTTTLAPLPPAPTTTTAPPTTTTTVPPTTTTTMGGYGY
jgi:predicted lipoprotein with Yx(FWY)xxD motif